MYDVYYVAVAVENFNTGYSSYKIYLFHQEEPSIMLPQKSPKYIADKATNLSLKKPIKY